MQDSYGDGWNGNYYTFSDGQSGTIDYGYEGSDEICLQPGCYDLTVDGGSWQEEVAWDFVGYVGGAPWTGEVCISADVDSDFDDWGYFYDSDDWYWYDYEILADD